jgi:Ca-activated chloride channel family protein
MPSLHLQHPILLAGLALVPVLALLWRRAAGRARRAARALGTGDEADAPQHNAVRGAMRIAALVALLVGLASPVALRRDALVPGLAPLVFVLDVSASMTAGDVEPDRLTAAREAVERLAVLADGARTALVAAAEDAAVVCPPTEDADAFLSLIGQARGDWMSARGTALLPALKAARRLIADDAGAGVVVLVSDGEDHGEPPDRLLGEMRREGIVVHTLVVGSREGVELAELPAAGTAEEAPLTRARPERMAAWARAGGGRAWAVGPAERSLPVHTAEVLPTGALKRAAARQGVGTPLAPYLFVLAAALLVLEPMLGR